ncbi:MAG: ABC transporter permease [Candidatus Hydrogenedentes bacterium]|nr:ABC transporter permease [Candidatus Hydrogenedentota bacterium]
MNTANDMPEKMSAETVPVTTGDGDTPPVRVLPDWLKPGHPIKHGGYITNLMASCGHALIMLTRRKRLLMATLIAFLPVLIPIALAFLSNSRFAESGNEVFVRLVENLHITVFTPLLALFFGGMLVAEDIETRTMPYILTRPVPRSAWVIGRFCAFMIVASVVLISSTILTFIASSVHEKLSITNPIDLLLLLHYLGVMVVALLAYGGFAVFLGAFTKRPIVYGIILLYGWQQLATQIPGLVDFFTIKKYIDGLLPVMATQRNVVEIQTALGSFQREVFQVSATKSIVVLLLIMAVSLLATIIAVTRREYAADRAAGG